MKITFSFVLIFFPIVTLSQSNEYFPLDSGNYWIYNDQLNTRIEVGGSKIINDKPYKIMLFGSSKADTSYYRVDGNRLFQFRNKTGDDWLLYDFSVLKDSVLFTDSNYVYKCYSSSIVLYQGRNHRQWMFGYHYPFFTDMDWYEVIIDSIGKVKYGGGIGFEYNLTQASIKGKVLIVTNAPNKIKNENYLLQMNVYPNPFNSSAIISFIIPREGSVEIVLFNSLGQEIRKLFNGYVRSGLNTFNFYANDLSSGIYLCRLKFEQQLISQKLQLLK